MILPIVLGRRVGTPQGLRLRQQSTLYASHDDKHFVVKCPAMQSVRKSFKLHHLALLRTPCSIHVAARYCGSCALRHGLFGPPWSSGMLIRMQTQARFYQP